MNQANRRGRVEPTFAELEARRIATQNRRLSEVSRACDIFLRSRGLIQPKGSFTYSHAAFSVHRASKAQDVATDAGDAESQDEL